MHWLWELTGGRPMRCDGHSFYDRVSGRGVYRYTDKLGREWLAENKWALFRVGIGNNLEKLPEEDI